MINGSGDTKIDTLRKQLTKRLDLAVSLIFLVLIAQVVLHYKDPNYTNLNLYILGIAVMLLFGILSLYFGGQLSLNLNLLSIFLISLALYNYHEINPNSFMILSFMHSLTFVFIFLIFISQISYVKYKNEEAARYNLERKSSILRSVLFSVIMYVLVIFPAINFISMLFYPATSNIWWILPNYPIVLPFNHALVFPVFSMLFGALFFAFFPSRMLHDYDPEERLLGFIFLIFLFEGSIIYEFYKMISGAAMPSWFYPFVSYGMLGLIMSITPLLVFFIAILFIRSHGELFNAVEKLRRSPKQLISAFLFTFLLSSIISLTLITIFNITPEEINQIRSSDLLNSLYYLARAFIRGFWEGELKPPIEYGIPLLYFTGPAAVYLWPTWKVRKSYEKPIRAYELILFALSSLLLIALFVAMLKLSLPTTSYWMGIFISVAFTVLSFYRILWEQNRVIANLKAKSARSTDIEYHSRRTLLHIMQASITLFVPALSIIGISEKFDINLIISRMKMNTIPLNVALSGVSMDISVEFVLLVITVLFSVLLMPLIGYIVPGKDLLDISNMVDGQYLKISRLKLILFIFMFIISTFAFMITRNFYYQFLFGTIMSYIIVCISNLLIIYKNPFSAKEDKE